ncbi:hypothetical protein CcaCcLH18_07651 [Colletotrichum camelliae]|nr:hypothetical protein CcaCcLH18_07651 [Colletotrichum camelliae]
MDPLSVTVSCIGLITAVAQVGSVISNFVTKCREARRDLAAVSAELAQLGITLDMLKDDGDGNDSAQLPQDLRQRICDLIMNCKGVIEELSALLEKYGGGGVNSAARWALSGKKEAAKIKASLEAHKDALTLVVEATTLHMATTAANDTGKLVVDSSLIKGYTMKIIDVLSKQDQILEQIAWVRIAISQRGLDSQGRTLAIDEYLDKLSSYAGSVCGDHVSDDIAEEMQRGSLDGSTDGTRTTLFGPTPMMPLNTFNDQPDLMTIVIGNLHRLVEPEEETPVNKHLWTFFVRTSGEEIIQEILVDLHPTFSPRQLLLKAAPYKFTRIGWGVFIISVHIKLKPGYLWGADNSPSLNLQWKLNFGAIESSMSHECPVKTAH